MKKICTFFGLLISMCLLLNVGFGSLSVKGAAVGNTEQTSDPNFTNLIVFARFADENEFVNDIYQGVSVREIIDNSYNTAYYSVGDYYRNASSDKLRMNSLYLFDNGGSLQLKHERGYYAVTVQIIQSVIKQVVKKPTVCTSCAPIALVP